MTLCSRARVLSVFADHDPKAAAALHKKLKTTPCTRREGYVTPADPEKQPLLVVSPQTEEADCVDKRTVARERFATELEEKEIADGLRDNPAVDAETQRAIVLEYRALHQRIKDEGLYTCRYSAYAKESIRYAILFGLFLYLLHAKWYLTSALALGLFWVRAPHLDRDKNNTDSPTATDHVHSPRRRPLRHHRQLRDRHSHRSLHCGLLLRSEHRMVEILTQRSPPRHQRSEPRPRHPELTPLLEFAHLHEVHPELLLQFPLRLGWRRRLPDPIPEVHILPRHGTRPVQLVHAFLAAPDEPTRSATRSSMVDAPSRDHLHGMLLVSLRILPRVAYASDMAHAHRIRAPVTHGNHDPTRPDHAIALGHAYCGPWTHRVVRPAPAPNYHGCGLRTLARFSPRWIAVPGCASSVPQGATT